MTFGDTYTKVLVVGAGPSGLMMAAQLLRNGVIPIIIDSKQGPTDQSKALAVQARSLEIYRQMGIADKAVQNGKPAEAVTFNFNGKQIATLDLKKVGKGKTQFPYLLMYPQSKNERMLLDFLTLNCCPVYWETGLVSLKQTGKQAEVQLISRGKAITLICDYVVGADGAHSVVRKQLQTQFKGDSYAHEFYLADAALDKELPENHVQLYFSDDGFSAFFPMPDNNRYRILGNLPDVLSNKEELKLEDVLPYLEDVAGAAVKVDRNYWFTQYRLHHRMADQFSVQRCFLIGDAAHIHSPVGGQGMNTGLQDAFNLAWKMAGVVNGLFSESLLNSYAAERIPVAKTLLNTTDRVFTTIMSGTWYSKVFKRWLMPGLLKFACSKESIREEFFTRVSQINISYRESVINLHLSTSTQIKAGDRLPYLKVFDEKKQQNTDLHEWCRKPGFVLMILGKLSEPDLFAIAKWITQKYPALLNFFYLPLSAKNQHVFDAFEITGNQGKSLIIRPDMHIGFMNDAVNLVLMDNYLQNIIGII